MMRYAPYAASLVLALASLVMAGWDARWLWGVAVFGALAVLGTVDLLQTRSTLRRNLSAAGAFPLRPGIDRPGDAAVLHRVRHRARCRSRASSARWSTSAPSRSTTRARSARCTTCTASTTSGSTIRWRPRRIAIHDFRIAIGDDRPAQPYSASVFNISAMSFGSLSANAIRALNEGAKRGGFYHDTGEGSISPYHREHGGDLVWEIGSGYFGCRDDEGRLQRAALRCQRQRDPQVQDDRDQAVAGRQARPWRRAAGAPRSRRRSPLTRGVPTGVDCVSPARHSAFSTRRAGCWNSSRGCASLSGGKPTGFKLAIGHPWEWFGIAKAMQRDRPAAGLHRRRRRRGRHRRGAGGVHRPRRRADARSADAGAQHAGRPGPARPHPHRRRRAHHQCVRHRAHHGDGRGLVQCRARFHVRAGLHPVAELPHRRVPDRRGDAGPAPLARSSTWPTRRARVQQLPPQHAAGAARPAVRGGPGASAAARPRTHPAARLADRSAFAGGALPLPGAGRAAGRTVPDHAVFRAFWASARSDSFAPPEPMRRMRESKSI